MELSFLKNQKQKLIERIPSIQHYFIDIYIPQFSETVSFLPIRCFRDFTLHLDYSAENERNYNKFYSSGSTGNKPSTHIFSYDALKVYEKNTCEGFLDFLQRNQLDKSTPLLTFIPPVEIWKNSSLSAMLSMFHHQEFNIIFCNLDESFENALVCLKKIENNSSCIIFGTSFHHFMLANLSSQEFKERIQNEFKRLNLSIIDTGGTKGRTQAYTLTESIEVLKSFYTSANLSIFSEYGMCELGSQAWSTHKIHDGTFQCNKTLKPFSVSIEANSVLPINELGFIAFIDSINYESYAAIITEDIGLCLDTNKFRLIGRGPDSSIKGCSLNVRGFFNFESQTQKLLIEINKQQKNILNLKDILFQLKEKDWNSFALEDLAKTLESIECKLEKDLSYQNKNMLIISAANTPIAWVFPYIIAAKNGVSSVTLKIPSLRLDDYYSGTVRKYTEDLIQVIANYFPLTKTYIDPGKSIAHTFNDYDIVLTFGSEETLTTLSKQVNSNITKFIGKGDIKNSLLINIHDNSPKKIAQSISLWNGRGCLTPVVLFLSGNEIEFANWINVFTQEFENEFLERTKQNEPEIIRKFCHTHNTAFVTGQIKELGMNINFAILRGKRTCVVNLAQYSVQDLKYFQPDFNFGGCGFIYLLHQSMRDKFKNLQSLSILPNIHDYFEKN
ncbi:hypothetical protein [Fluviispira multicolorata]|uniref:Uncharacterized protein n=1 Tax=Fluviispira multicolorata TaxID=2654512 RepID=A0A833JBW3_9BACT|nr:hypothetical protein [Fluviispira multicolorata]KAB8029188.1 hypothetical protein GCL57_11670 [Fluviispira multicolorata]